MANSGVKQRSLCSLDAMPHHSSPAEKDSFICAASSSSSAALNELINRRLHSHNFCKLTYHVKSCAF